MRPWARWTARTALVAAGLAAAGGGLSGPALAGTGTSGTVTVLGGTGPLAPIGLPADVCADLDLGIAAVSCGGTPSSAAAPEGSTTAGSSHHAPASGTVSSTATNVGGGHAGGPGASAASTGLSADAGPGAASAALRPAFGDTLDAPGPGADTPGNTAVSQIAGPGSLPGLADLPSLAGPAHRTGRGGGAGGSTLMAGGALSASDASGMSSDSFAALAIGALLAGAAALKIASRRARDRKAGIGATI